MEHQHRPSYINNYSPASSPHLISSNTNSLSQYVQSPFTAAPFPLNVTTPPFMVIPPPSSTGPPPPMAISTLRNTPGHTGFLPPMGILPPTNVPPPTMNVPPPTMNVPPPTHIVSPCYPPTNMNAVPSAVPPYIIANQSHFLANTNVTPTPHMSACPPPPLPPQITLPEPQDISHNNFTSFGPQITTTVDLRPVPPANDITRDGTRISMQEHGTDNEDELWLKNWLSQRLMKKPDRQEKYEMTVCSARLLLRDALYAISDLKASVGYLRNSTNADEDMWKFKIRKAVKAKEKLTFLLSQFSPETLKSLKRRVKRIQAKRGRIRRQRLQAIENQKLDDQERENQHAIIDSWRNKIQDAVTNEKKKAELKNEADNILSEVRKKVQEAKKVLDQLGVLKKLRTARLENSEKKGLKVSSASTEHFEEKVERLKTLMERQLSVYEAEEHALKVMLETEREQEKQDQQQQKIDVFKMCQQDTLQRLFSKPPDPSSPLFFYWQYYMQGQSDLQSLVQIRHQWDIFLVPQDDPVGSPIPLGWILPKPPSSSKWESVLNAGDPKSD